jgi:hypothetical protein
MDEKVALDSEIEEAQREYQELVKNLKSTENKIQSLLKRRYPNRDL